LAGSLAKETKVSIGGKVPVKQSCNAGAKD